MAFEPINIFSCRIDPRGVVELLRHRGLAVRVTGPDDDWKETVVTVKKGGLLRKPILMTFGHESDYYDGDSWPKQVMGMQGYFSRFADVPRKKEILQTIGAFRFALSVPQHDLDIDSDDERLALLYAVCQHLDGVIFTPSSLRDAQGRILMCAGGEFDPAAVLPAMPSVANTADESIDASKADQADEESDEPNPPTANQVARRALALTAVAARATLELDAEGDAAYDQHRLRLLDWIESLDIGSELEPDEWKVLQRPIGKIEQQAFLNAMWRVEGLVVLAWALGRFELPPDDQLVIPPDLYQSLGIFDVDAGRELLESAELRPAEELDAMQVHLLMLHWRLRDFSIRPESTDFVALSKKCWFGSFDISGFQIVNNDLAIDGVPIAHATDEQRQMVSSLAMERHLAINWLMGYSKVYSETDTST